jgi:ABC-type glutathione transport system ATPase component
MNSGTGSTTPDRKAASQRVLTARGLAKDYVMGEVVVHALTGVDLDIERGEFVVLLGQVDASSGIQAAASVRISPAPTWVP